MFTEYQLEQIKKDLDTIMETKSRLRSMSIKGALRRKRSGDPDFDTRGMSDSEPPAPRPFEHSIQNMFEQARAGDPDDINSSIGSWN